MAHPQTNFSSNFQGVDPPLEGYWHDDPIPCGGGNVVTDIWPNPAGVPVVVKGFNALTDEDIADKLDNTGDASNTTSTFTKTSGDTSSMTSGSKLSVIFTAISSFFASLKALAFKDKAAYSDLSSGVQSSLDKADSALQSHQSVTDNNPTLAWGTTSKVGTVGSTDLRVTMPTNPAQNLPASVITSGTFGTDRIADDAITAAKVKDNETLPVNVSGCATYLLPLVHFSANNITQSTQYALIARKRYSGNDTRPGELFRLFYNDVFIDFKTYGIINPSAQTASITVAPLQSFGIGKTDWTNRLHVTWTNDPSAQTIDVNIYFKFNVGENRFVTLYQYNGQAGGDRYNYTWTPYQGIENYYEAAASGTEATYEWDRTYLFGSALYASKIGSYSSHPQIGSHTTPVYVDSNGQVQPCDVLSGGTSNFNKRFTWTYTVNQNDQYITTAVINDNTNYIAEYVEWHNANVGKLTHPPLIILSVSARTNVANAGLISLCMYRNGEGCDVIGEDYTYMGNVHGSSARNTQYFTDRPFYNGEPYYLCIRNETPNPMWAAGTILDISIRIVAHAVSVT